MTRDRVALTAPGDRSLTDFPGWRLARSREVKRVHRTDNGPWWFSSSGRGGFDLTAPRGTCYAAFDDGTAVPEVVGEALATLGVVAHAFAAERTLSTLRLPTPYDVPQAWAAAFDADFDGIRYQTRFPTGPIANAAAVFGPTGAADWPADPHPEPLAAAAQRCGIAVQPVPRSVRIVDPPD